MLTHFAYPARIFVLICWMTLSAWLMPTILYGDERPATKTVREAKQLEKRIRRLERRLQALRENRDSTDSSSEESDAASTPRRFQMLRVGERIVILDSDTGETRVIDDRSESPVQHVEVGKALVVVTVLGRVMTVPVPPTAAPAKESSSAPETKP